MKKRTDVTPLSRFFRGDLSRDRFRLLNKQQIGKVGFARFVSALRAFHLSALSEEKILLVFAADVTALRALIFLYGRGFDASACNVFELVFVDFVIFLAAALIFSIFVSLRVSCNPNGYYVILYDKSSVMSNVFRRNL